MIWIILLNSPLNFLCWKWNYLLYYLCSWGPLSVCTCRQKNCSIRYYDRDNSQKKTKPTWILGPLWFFSNLRGNPGLLASESDVLHRICWDNSPASVRHPSSKDVDFWLTFLHIFNHSLLWCFSLSIWCSSYIHPSMIDSILILHTWTYVSIPIVLQYFVITKTLEKLYESFMFQHNNPYSTPN